VIRRTRTINYDDSWDGTDRRNNTRPNNWQGIDRRSHDFDDNSSIVIENIQPAHQSTKASDIQNAGLSKVLTSGPVLSAIFSLIFGLGGFIFDLYKRTTTLEYTQSNITEKVEEIKITNKESSKDVKHIQDQLRSIEETMMQMYRQKK